MFMSRPMPPETVTAVDARITFAPAPELAEWAMATFIEDDGRLHNPDHFHRSSDLIRERYNPKLVSSQLRADKAQGDWD